MTVGTPPLAGMEQGLVDATWLLGIAAGQNETFQSGITAAGTTQAGATQLPSGIALIEIDTAPANAGVALPFAIAGTEIGVFNATSSTTLKYYPNVANNPLTGAQDTINGATSVTTPGAQSVTWFSCAKNGIWGAK